MFIVRFQQPDVDGYRGIVQTISGLNLKVVKVALSFVVKATHNEHVTCLRIDLKFVIVCLIFKIGDDVIANLIIGSNVPVCSSYHDNGCVERMELTHRHKVTCIEKHRWVVVLIQEGDGHDTRGNHPWNTIVLGNYHQSILHPNIPIQLCPFSHGDHTQPAHIKKLDIATSSFEEHSVQIVVECSDGQDRSTVWGILWDRPK